MLEIAILCGGFGVRMGKLTSHAQKCMLQIRKRPILQYLLDQISIAFGQAKITLVVGYESNSIRDYFGKRYKKLRLEYIPESTEGIRLALLAAENFIQEDSFFVIAGDTIIKGSEFLNLNQVKSKDSLGIMLVSAKREVAPTHGLVTMENRRVSKIQYPPTQSAFGRHAYSFMGTGFYSHLLFEELKKYDASNLTEVLLNSVKAGRIVEAEICTTRWFHFGSPEDLKTKIEF